LSGFFLSATLLCVFSGFAAAQESGGAAETTGAAAQGPDTLLVVRTGSPRETLQSWLGHARKAETLAKRSIEEPTHANLFRATYNVRRLLAHLDLSQTPAAVRNEAGIRATYALHDILLRVELPPMDEVPDWDSFDESAPAKWRLPGTPITIARMEKGPRAGEYLFSATSVADAPGFYKRISHLPAQRPSLFDSWTEAAPQLTGPLIPAALVELLPDFVKKTALGTPIWKILLSVVALGLVVIVFVLLQRWISRRTPDSPFTTMMRRMLTPLVAIALTWMLHLFLQVELNTSGAFSRLSDSTLSVVTYVALAWLSWLAVLAAFEWIILSPKIPEQSLNANLLRLCARLVGLLGFLSVLAMGAQSLGIPVLGVVAGLGFGGLAIALAIRPTLENLMGGLILFMDKPVRVGDFCSFGNHTGTVEEVGIRSTKIRALDRTLISVPNASFVNMELVNWARCDKMLILAVIGLRYETEPDQLRLVLARLREMLFAHPKIDRTTVRVRFIGYGSSSLDVQIRVYALTQEWNEFHAIREDVFLRVNKIVAESGTSFAFPSQTLYLGRDSGLDQQLSEAAKEQVAGWRSNGKLPFPDPAAARIDALEGTLDYPPRGSVEEYRREAAESHESEQLSGAPPTKQPDEDTQSEKR
jgi:MscS family membrane protein